MLPPSPWGHTVCKTNAYKLVSWSLKAHKDAVFKPHTHTKSSTITQTLKLLRLHRRLQCRELLCSTAVRDEAAAAPWWAVDCPGMGQELILQEEISQESQTARGDEWKRRRGKEGGERRRQRAYRQSWQWEGKFHTSAKKDRGKDTWGSQEKKEYISTSHVSQS